MDNGICDILVVLMFVFFFGEVDCIYMDVKEYVEFRCVGFVLKYVLGFENVF